MCKTEKTFEHIIQLDDGKKCACLYTNFKFDSMKRLSNNTFKLFDREKILMPELNVSANPFVNSISWDYYLNHKIEFNNKFQEQFKGYYLQPDGYNKHQIFQLETNQGIIYVHQRYLNTSENRDEKILITDKGWISTSKVRYYDVNFLSDSIKVNLYFQVNNDNLKPEVAQVFIQEFIEHFKIDYCKK